VGTVARRAPAPAPAAAAAPARVSSAPRVPWLDGVRGVAAMFVVAHHMWLAVWPAFPRDTGPWWLGPLLYGHLAVAVFIVVSGFSLALAPLRNGGRLPGGVRRFIRRRAWRILPAYWVALVFSTVVAATLLHSVTGTGAIAKSLAVHGLLVQDAVGSQAPNGAFWSIAIEWQIYFVFPLILWVARRRGVEVAAALTVAVVVAAHLVARAGHPFDKVDHLTPQFLALFALGVLAVHLGRDERGERLRRPAGAMAATAFAAVVAFALIAGSERTVAAYFWVDLAFGLAAACLLCALCAGGAAWIRRPLQSRAGLRLGLFSYSIYLMHAPVVGVLDLYAVRPLGLPPVAHFAALAAVGVPVVLAVCWGFHLLFEAPFLRHRDMRSLHTVAVRLPRLAGRRRPALPAPDAAPAANDA
jgi:peptidoglycan/LPS O-acetylase OafA/YrhL